MNNPADGRKRYCSVYGKTYKEVKEKLFIRKREHILDKGGCGCLPDGITMGEAVRMWLEERRYRWKESTFSTYRSIIEKHILPVIGKWMVETWNTASYREYFKILRKRKEGKELSENYLHQIQIILSQILRFLDGKYHCGGLEQPHAYAAMKQRPVHTPLGTDIRKLEEYLQNEAAKGGCDLPGEFC